MHIEGFFSMQHRSVESVVPRLSPMQTYAYHKDLSGLRSHENDPLDTKDNDLGVVSKAKTIRNLLIEHDSFTQSKLRRSMVGTFVGVWYATTDVRICPCIYPWA